MKTILQKDIPAGIKYPIFSFNKSSQKNFWKMTVHLPFPMPKPIVRKKVGVVVVFVAVGLFVCLFVFFITRRLDYNRIGDLPGEVFSCLTILQSL